MYEQIARNQRDSWLLMAGVTLLLAALGCAISLAEGLPWHAGALLAAAAGVGACLYAWFGGGALVLAVNHAQHITRLDNPRLYNVVEEMSIASGLPVPKVYIVNDPAPNAFATGREPENAAVAVTTGLLEMLDRDELQGVIAHEMAHIRNRDTRLLVLLAVLVGGIALLSDAYWRMNRFGGRRKGSGQAQALFFAVAIVLAILAPIVARVLEMAVSRRREYLADASAGMITRYPAGLASALEKISGHAGGLASAGRATQHLYIVNPLKAAGGRAGLFSTHPDVEDRIRRLREMAFEGIEPGPRNALDGAPGFARMGAGRVPDSVSLG